MSYTQGDTIKDMTIYESKNITIKDIYNKIKSKEVKKAKLPTILFQDKNYQYHYQNKTITIILLIKKIKLIIKMKSFNC